MRRRAWRRQAPWGRSFRSISRRRRRSWSSNVHEAPAPDTDVLAKPSLSVSPSWWKRPSRQQRRASQVRGRAVFRSRHACVAACQGAAARWRAPFFESDAAAVEEAPHGALGDPQTVLVFQMGGDPRQGHVRGLVQERKHHLGMGLDPLRAPVATLRSRSPADLQSSGSRDGLGDELIGARRSICLAAPGPSRIQTSRGGEGNELRVTEIDRTAGAITLMGRDGATVAWEPARSAARTRAGWIVMPGLRSGQRAPF